VERELHSRKLLPSNIREDMTVVSRERESGRLGGWACVLVTLYCVDMPAFFQRLLFLYVREPYIK
jgi:hypothetical protein